MDVINNTNTFTQVQVFACFLVKKVLYALILRRPCEVDISGDMIILWYHNVRQDVVIWVVDLN